MEKLYSIPGAAQELGGLSVHTVRKWLSTGRLQRTKVGGRTMIAESELRKVISISDGMVPHPHTAQSRLNQEAVA